MSNEFGDVMVKSFVGRIVIEKSLLWFEIMHNFGRFPFPVPREIGIFFFPLSFCEENSFIMLPYFSRFMRLFRFYYWKSISLDMCEGFMKCNGVEDGFTVIVTSSQFSRCHEQDRENLVRGYECGNFSPPQLGSQQCSHIRAGGSHSLDVLNH